MLERPRILVVEDESGIADTIQYVLATDGFTPVLCATAEQALTAFSAQRPALAILDVGLPDLNGFELFKRLQALPGGPQVPMLFLTARSDEIDRVVGLELGADDYIAKPFSPRELVARVRTILRRSTRPAGDAAVASAATPPQPLHLDEERRLIRYYGRVLELSRYEYGVLRLLLRKPGRVFTREELLAQVWDDDSDSFDRTIDAHIKTLRAKLKAVRPDVDAIRTSRGTGYALNEALPRLNKRNRIFIGIVLIFVAGVAFVLYRAVADLDPRYRESAEESLVETAQLMATLVEQDVSNGAISTTRIEPLFRAVQSREFEARIFSVTKRHVDLRMVVTDAKGRALFDSQSQHTGEDYSQWRDVRLALRGEYGARTSMDVEGRPETTTMYVGAPVRSGGRIIGAVSIGKPTQSFGQFVEAARRKTLIVGIVSAAGVVLLAVLVSAWLVRPFGMTTDYLRYIRAQRRLNLPRLARQAAAVIRAAYDEVRDALAGRNYVADYVQTLTHELKSPLSAIRGATELLQEAGMPQAERERFLANIDREAGRIQEVVDRMMELTVLETQRALAHVEAVSLRPLLDDVANSARTAAAPRGICIEVAAGDHVQVDGDPFLLRRALSNLVDNAVDFSPQGGLVRLQLERTGRHAVIRVQDDGPGIPSYAHDKLFERFYSLARPHSGRKSTGLGLSFVRGIAALHHGRIDLANAPGQGALATLTLPANL